MEEEAEDVQGYYGGVEPTDVGDLTDVKPERQHIPATKRVRVRLEKPEARTNKGDMLKGIPENTYRSINLQCRIVDGVDDVDVEGNAIKKYKNKVVFGRVCYYADPNYYTKEFFKKRQHLLQLKYLANATGVDLNKVDGHKIIELENKEVYVDILVKKRQSMLAGQPMTDEKGLPVFEFSNEVVNYKEIPAEELV